MAVNDYGFVQFECDYLTSNGNEGEFIMLYDYGVRYIRCLNFKLINPYSLLFIVQEKRLNLSSNIFFSLSCTMKCMSLLISHDFQYF